MNAFGPGTSSARPKDFRAGQRVISCEGMRGTVMHASSAKRGQSAGHNWIRVRWENGHEGRVSTHVGNIKIEAS